MKYALFFMVAVLAAAAGAADMSTTRAEILAAIKTGSLKDFANEAKAKKAVADLELKVKTATSREKTANIRDKANRQRTTKKLAGELADAIKYKTRVVKYCDRIRAGYTQARAATAPADLRPLLAVDEIPVSAKTLIRGAIASEQAAAKKAQAAEIASKPVAWRDCGNDFQYANLSTKINNLNTVRVYGEMRNDSFNDYKTASFTMTLYSAENKIVDSCGFHVRNFQTAQTKNFDTIFLRVPDPSNCKIKIQFESAR